MVKLTKKQVVRKIDRLIDRYWSLCHSNVGLKEKETRELRAMTKEVSLLKIGKKISGMDLKEYLALTDREWGDKINNQNILLGIYGKQKEI